MKNRRVVPPQQLDQNFQQFQISKSAFKNSHFKQKSFNLGTDKRSYDMQQQQLSDPTRIQMVPESLQAEAIGKEGFATKNDVIHK